MIFAGGGAVILHVGVVARECLQHFRRHAPDSFWGRLHRRADISPSQGRILVTTVITDVILKQMQPGRHLFTGSVTVMRQWSTKSEFCVATGNMSRRNKKSASFQSSREFD
jgi:hypothetical protein